MPWLNNLYKATSKRPIRFKTIKQVAEFLEIDLKWVPPHIQKWSKIWSKRKTWQVIASVGNLKSNWVFLEIVKEILNDYPKFNTPILFGAESDDSAKDMTIRVKEALDSEPVKEEFGKLQGEKWTDGQLWIKNRSAYLKGANFFSVGVKGALEGRRYQLAYLDDPIGLKKAISRAEREYVEKWISHQFWPRINWTWGGRLLIIGSYWGPLDVYHYLPKEHNVKVSVYPAHKDNKKYSNRLWPEGMTVPALKELRRNMPEATYQLRYLCNDKGMTGKAFKPEWFQTIPRKDIPVNLLIVHQGWDLAFTEKDIIGKGQQVKEEPDFTAGFVGGIDIKKGNIYLLDLYHERIVLGHADAIEQMYKLWPMTKKVGIETNQAQALVYHQARAKPTGIPVSKVKHYSIDKITRVLNLEPYFKQYRIFINEDMPHLEEFNHEYVVFPTQGYHDDIMDALEILIKSFVTGRASSIGEQFSKFL